MSGVENETPTAEVTIPVTASPSKAPKTSLKNIPLKQIRESKIALRDVDKTDEKYLGLVESIRHNGVYNAIVVRELGKEDGEMVYGLVDGLQRYTASGDAGRPTIPAQVVELSDAKVLEAQIIANVHRIETKKFQYAKQLDKILAENPFLTMSQLADSLSKSPGWLSDQLGLTKLPDDVGGLVDEGKISLSNAYVLAKLPPEEMPNFIERAMTQQPGEFAPQVNARVKEVREARRQGREARGESFVPTPFVQKIGDIKAELENPQALVALIDSEKPKTPIEAAKLALQWVLHTDSLSLAAAEQKYNDKKLQDKEEKSKRDREKLAKKTLEAQRIARELSEKANATGIDLDAEADRIAAEAAAAEEAGEGEPYEKEPVNA